MAQTDKSSDDAKVLTELSGLAAELAASATDAKRASEAADAVVAQFATLDEDAQKRVISNPAVQKLFARVAEVDAVGDDNDPPGTVYYRTDAGGNKSPWDKKPWTWQDAYRRFPSRTFAPSKTMTLIWNGLGVTVFAHEEVTLPDVFYGVWADHMKAVKTAEQHARFLMKKGPLPDDRTVLTPDGMRARSLANHDGAGNLYAPGAGIIADWSPDLLTETPGAA